MADKSSIEWTDATWNPTRGCSCVSPGCKHCYAMKVAARFSGRAGGDMAEWPADLRVREFPEVRR